LKKFLFSLKNINPLRIQAINNYLTKQPEEIREICEKLLETAKESMPGAIEIFAHGAPGYSTTNSSYDRIVYIVAQKKWVNLGFFFGSDIPDPEKLMEGTGVRMRHIKIKNKTEVSNPAVHEILKAAWKKAPLDMEKIHQKKK
jgi:hypothetical protein